MRIIQICSPLFVLGLFFFVAEGDEGKRARRLISCVTLPHTDLMFPLAIIREILFMRGITAHPRI